MVQIWKETTIASLNATTSRRSKALSLPQAAQYNLRLIWNIRKTNSTCVLVKSSKMRRSGKSVCTHGGTRTPNLRFRRPTPYPLGHAGTVGHIGLQPEHMDGESDLIVKSSASPGNRTRVARMGILHDTTTPATHSLGQLPNKVCLANPVFRSDCRQIFGLNPCMLGFWCARNYTARLAQSVEHETLNLRVVGSSPTLGEHFIMKHVIIIFFGDMSRNIKYI